MAGDGVSRGIISAPGMGHRYDQRVPTVPNLFKCPLEAIQFCAVVAGLHVDWLANYGYGA